MNYTLRLIEALTKAGYKVRYTSSRWGRGYKYKITGIGRANYKYADHAIAKAETLVQAKRSYKLSDSALEQRRQARESKRLLSSLNPEEQALYREIRKLYKNKANVKKFKVRHPGSTGKAPSIQQILKIHPARRYTYLLRRRDELRGNANMDDLEGLATALEDAGRITGVDVYDIVAKLRSGDYTMTLEEFQDFSQVLKDSNNPNYWRKQINPADSIQKVADSLTAFFANK